MAKSGKPAGWVALPRDHPWAQVEGCDDPLLRVGRALGCQVDIGWDVGAEPLPFELDRLLPFESLASDVDICPLLEKLVVMAKEVAAAGEPAGERPSIVEEVCWETDLRSALEVWAAGAGAAGAYFAWALESLLEKGELEDGDPWKSQRALHTIVGRAEALAYGRHAEEDHGGPDPALPWVGGVYGVALDTLHWRTSVTVELAYLDLDAREKVNWRVSLQGEHMTRERAMRWAAARLALGPPSYVAGTPDEADD